MNPLNLKEYETVVLKGVSRLTFSSPVKESKFTCVSDPGSREILGGSKVD
jgi:hypothetical protein